MSYWVAGATVVSGALGSMGAKDAAEQQRRAAATAAALRSSLYEQGKSLQLPFLNSGTMALEQLMQRLPELTQGYDPQRLLAEPGYEFGRSEGQRSLEQSLAARGLGVSGAALKRAARYGNDYATTKLGEAFNRDRTMRLDGIDALMRLAGGGQRAAESISTQGNNYAAGAAGDLTGAGNAQAAGTLGSANVWGDAINQLGGWWSANAKKGNGKTSGGWGTGDEYGNQDYGQYFADGGEVRVEPRPGSRAPRRAGGTGGGMSRQAVLDALDVAWRDAPTTPAAAPGTVPRVEAAVDRATRTGYKNGGKVRRADPTEGQSFGENLMAGVGQGIASVIRAAGGRRVLEAMDLPATDEEAALLDAPLLNSPAGASGSVVGQTLPAAAVAPFVPIPVSAALVAGPAMADLMTAPARRLRDADRARMVRDFSTGGPVRGKSSGKADAVPARLSAGEHVIDAEVVAMLGDGNSEAGHALLEELKRRVRAYKRSAPADKPAPAAG